MVRRRFGTDAGGATSGGGPEQNGQRNGAHVLLSWAWATSEEVSLNVFVLDERDVATEGGEARRAATVKGVGNCMERRWREDH